MFKGNESACLEAVLNLIQSSIVKIFHVIEGVIEYLG